MDIPVPQPWELHPMLVHFPIAFLLVVVLLILTGYVGGSIVYHPSFTNAMTLVCVIGRIRLVRSRRRGLFKRRTSRD